MKLAVLLGCFILTWSIAAQRLVSEVPQNRVCPVVLTQTIYDQVQYGMPTEEVISLIGTEASSEFLASSKGGETMKLIWSGNGQFLAVDFWNNRVVSKDQHNLQ